MTSSLVIFRLPEEIASIEDLLIADIIILPNFGMQEWEPIDRWLNATRFMLDDLLTNKYFENTTKALIIMRNTAKQVASMLMISMALNLININPEIWIISDLKGEYISLQSFAVSGQDWAETFKEHQRIKAIEEIGFSSNLEESDNKKQGE